ncbi:MAG TPA: outer membrane lipid asymmetry maintenance protein MlaD [Acetobacteraceae bacterium]|nr:outer membrane lipid asymmetry maintenance protein MlaD [Acetobacteraceae bacterium]
MPHRSLAEILTGALVLLVAVGFLGYAVAHSGRTGGSGYTLYADFDNISGLSVGNDVRVAGVKIGTVTNETIDPKTFQARVSFTVQNDIKLPKDSAAEITSESLLGGKYISLSPGGEQQMLQPGQTVTITQSSINIESLLGKFIFSASNLAGGGKQGQSGTQGGSGSGELAPLGGGK